MLKKYIMASTIAAIISLLIGIVFHEQALSIFTSMIATIYIIMLSSGRRFAFILGSIFAVSYAVVSYTVGLYAATIFHLFYLFPVTIISFLRWGKDNNESKKSLQLKGWCWMICVLILAFAILYFILKRTNDPQPLLDAVSFAMSVVTGILMIGKYREYWVTNTVSCALFIIIWIVEFIHSGNGINMIILQSIALLASINGIYHWIKEDLK